MNENIEKQTSVTGAVFWKSLERVSSQVLNLVIQIVLARLIAPEQFGQLAIIIVVVNFLAIFVQSGVSTIIVQKKDLSKEDVSTLFTLLLAISLFLYLLLFFCSPLISSFMGYGDLTWHIRVAGLLIFTYFYNSIQLGLLMRQLRFKSIFFRSVIVLPITGVLSVLMALYGFGIWALIAFHLMTSVMTCVVMFFCIKDKPTFRVNANSFKNMFPFIAKIIGATVISSVNDLVRTILIGKNYSDKEVAFYDKGLTYSSYPTQIVTTSMSNAMLPYFSKNQDNKKALKEMCRKSVTFTSFISFPILLGFFAVSKDFVLAILGEEWAGCIGYLMAYCILRLPSCIAILDKQVYYSTGKSGIVLLYELIVALGCLSSTFLCIFVSPLNQSAMNIVYFVALIEYLGFVAIIIISKKIFDYKITERLLDLWKPLLCSIIMAFAVFLMSRFLNVNAIIKLFVEVFTGIILYLLLSFAFKEKNLFLLLNKLFHKNKNV